MEDTLISACIIARDEERVLGRCLDSIRDACDEICLVDTGSSDGTAAIATAAGAKVVRFTGCNNASGRIVDFSLARNKSLDLATGRWVLWIDADEFLLPRSTQRIRRHARTEDYLAVCVRLENGGSHWPAVRLFRRTRHTRFCGTVHEWPTIRGAVENDERIVIRNLPDKRGKELSFERDLRLCCIALERDPRDTRMLFYLARALQKSGDFDAAIIRYQEYLGIEKRFRAGRQHAQHRIAVCHLLRSRFAEARAAARVAARMDKTRAESHCVVGDACLALGRVEEARDAYRRALDCPPAPQDYPLFTDQFFYARYPTQQLRRIAGILSKM